MANDAWKAQDCETFSYQSCRSKNRISIQNYTMCSSYLMPIFFLYIGCSTRINFFFHVYEPNTWSD